MLELSLFFPDSLAQNVKAAGSGLWNGLVEYVPWLHLNLSPSGLVYCLVVASPFDPLMAILVLDSLCSVTSQRDDLKLACLTVVVPNKALSI